ncbi:MAG: DNA mismatch repair endonuclease MutL [Planctomycetota bacterium]
MSLSCVPDLKDDPVTAALAIADDTARRIRQLPMSVINKISAGEVIERPASVVKELLENSLDAGATRVDIDVELGGIELIRVVDNGHGIGRDDLQLAFANHATSKLAHADDLFQIQTLGFRGEALSSIGGIAQVTMQSRPHDQPVGAEISCHGGDLSPVRLWNGAAGTRIEVRHLFFNTPVRRKFMKSPSTEMGHLCEVVTRMALAQPGLHLTLRNNGKIVYEVPASAGLVERIGLFFGPEIRDQLYEIDARQGLNHLYGFVADPACDRGTAKLQYLFLNGRWIRDRALGHAMQEAFRGLLMTGRYAVTFVFLDVPVDSVDVNVHPTKAEVRFRDAQMLFSFVLATIRQRLNRENLVPRLQAPRAPLGDAGGFLQPPPAPTPSGPSLFAQAGLPSFVKRPLPEPPPRLSASSPWSETTVPADAGLASNEPTPPALVDFPPAPEMPVLEPQAIQLHNAYIVLETSDGMLVIDQHALHERVLFEKFKDRIQTGTLETQRLLIPEPVDLPPDHAAKTLEHKAALAELGLGVEDFGGGTLLVTSYPAMLKRTHPAEILKSVVDFLVTQDRPPTKDILLTELLSRMACHAAVRSGDPLTAEEMSELVKLRHLASDTHHCPHGRPTALLFTRHELDKQFRRI